MRVVRYEGAVLVIGRLVAPGASATTFGRFVFIRPDALGSSRLLRHELEHVQQWRRHGVPRFLSRYVSSYLRWRLRRHPHWAAYRRIPLEIEAEWTARTSPRPLPPVPEPRPPG